MPTEYKRKLSGERRGQWTEENLRKALKRIEDGDIGINEAARYYGIPARTLRRRKATGKLTKVSLGPSSTLGVQNEKRLVQHIQRLEKSGFAPDRTTVRRIAFQFAEALKIDHKFNREEGLAGYEWLNSFLRRNQELRIRSAEGLSLARAEGMSKKEVNSFFNILKDAFDENDFYNKPGNIFNIDETGCHLNNEPGEVLASKGARDVHVLTSGEKGENVSVIACCNAEGIFLPPVLIFKGKNENPAFSVGLPPGSEVYMNVKSSYITSELFFQWLKHHFTPRKPPGKVLLVMDGHSSHQSSIEMLEFADNNDILLVCLPSHTTQALQPLDRSFFKPLKTFYKKETMAWVQHNKKSIKKVHAGMLIGNAWVKSATAENAINGFRATGIFPLNPDAIPEHFFRISDSSVTPTSVTNLSNNDEPVSPETSSHDVHHLLESNVRDESSIRPSTSQTEEVVPCFKETPTKHLHEISPVPVIEKKSVKENSRQKF